MGKSSKTSSVTKASSSKPATGKVVAKAAPAKTAPAAKAAIPAAKSAPTAKAPAKAVPAKPVTKAIAKPAAKAAASAVPAKPAAPVKPATKAPASIPAKSPAQVAAKTAVNGSAKNGSAKTVAPASSKASANGSAKAMVKEVPPPIKYKNPFQSDELSKWRELLLSRRAEISGDIAGLVKDAMEAEDGHTTPNHIAERGSDADLQDLSLGVAGEEKDVVWQIDRALRKIDELKPLPFGLCEFTKESIPRTRLQLIPWTPLSIEGATHMEKSNLELEDLLIDD